MWIVYLKQVSDNMDLRELYNKSDENTKEILEIQSEINELIDKLYSSDEFQRVCSDYHITIDLSYKWDYEFEVSE